MAKPNSKYLRRKIPKPTLQDILPKNSSSKFPENRYCCTECQGIGVIVAPGEQSDPIEGHKLSARIRCPECNGERHVSVDVYKEILKEKILEWKKYEPARKEMIKKLKTAMLKLTEEEVELIKDFSGSNWPCDYAIHFYIKRNQTT